MMEPYDGLGLSSTDSQEPACDQTMTSLDNIAKASGKLHRRPLKDSRNSSQKSSTRFDVPDSYVNLDDLAGPTLLQNPDGDPLYQREPLEEARQVEQDDERDQAGRFAEEPAAKSSDGIEVSRFATQLYTISYLVLFAIFGTLARLGLQAITFYPGAPVVFSELWANLGGSVIIGFLSEDRMLFRDEWGTPTYDRQLEKAKKAGQDHEDAPRGCVVNLAAAKKAHAATKKTIPLYIGLATGFCGSFTSFSSFIRDVFLALSNDLPSPLNHPGYPPVTSTTSTISRNGGYSFMAVLAVIIITISVCISGMHFGAHLAIALEPYTPTVPFSHARKFLDPLVVLLAWGSWLGCIILAVFPPDRPFPIIGDLARESALRTRLRTSWMSYTFLCLAAP